MYYSTWITEMETIQTADWLRKAVWLKAKVRVQWLELRLWLNAGTVCDAESVRRELRGICVLWRIST